MSASGGSSGIYLAGLFDKWGVADAIKANDEPSKRIRNNLPLCNLASPWLTSFLVWGQPIAKVFLLLG